MSAQPAKKLSWSSASGNARILRYGSRAQYAVTPMHDAFSQLRISKKTGDIMVARDLVVLLAEWLRKADPKSVDWRKAALSLIRSPRQQPTKAKPPKSIKASSQPAEVTKKRRGRPPGPSRKAKTSPPTSKSENGQAGPLESVSL